jgi:hypothetical protein
MRTIMERAPSSLAKDDPHSPRGSQQPPIECQPSSGGQLGASNEIAPHSPEAPESFGEYRQREGVTQARQFIHAASLHSQLDSVNCHRCFSMPLSGAQALAVGVCEARSYHRSCESQAGIIRGGAGSDGSRTVEPMADCQPCVLVPCFGIPSARRVRARSGSEQPRSSKSCAGRVQKWLVSNHRLRECACGDVPCGRGNAGAVHRQRTRPALNPHRHARRGCRWRQPTQGP